jgi:transcriptional regulator with XRE-family HTH domain
MEKTEALGERIKELRKAARLTQGELAEKVGVNPHTIKDYEAGRRSPPMKKLDLIAGAVGVSTSDLVNVSTPAPAPIEIPASTILKRYLKIPDDIVQRAQAHDVKDQVWALIRIAFDEAEAHQGRKQAQDPKKRLG